MLSAISTVEFFHWSKLEPDPLNALPELMSALVLESMLYAYTLPLVANAMM